MTRAHAAVRLWLRRVPFVALVLLGTLWLYSFIRTPVAESAVYTLEIRMTAAVADGTLRVFFDEGHGFSAGRLMVSSPGVTTTPRTHRLAIPSGRFRAIRIDPIESSAPLTILEARISSRLGDVIRTFEAADFRPLNDISALNQVGHALEVSVRTGANDPQLLLPLDPWFDSRPEQTPGLLAISCLVSVMVSCLLRWRWRRLLPVQISLSASLRVSARTPHKQRWFRPREVAAVFGAASVLVAMGTFVYVAPGTDEVTASPFVFVADITPSKSGLAQLFYDLGAGISQTDSSTRPILEDVSTTCEFPLPEGEIHGLRLDYLNGPGAVDILHCRIENRTTGKIVHHFSTEDFTPNDHIGTFLPRAAGFRAATAPEKFDPFVTVALPAPLQLKRPACQRCGTILLRGLAAVALLAGSGLGLLAILRTKIGQTVAVAVRTLTISRPFEALAYVAAVATLLCCYPVAFFQQSLFSPNYGSYLLYSGTPTVPGMTDLRTESTRGADVGAMMWQHVPYTSIQHRALLRDHEWPLWNRFNSGGTVLLGQGQSMWGDPLHLPVILANSATWAWDLKFLLARFLLAWGAGWVVLTATRNLGVASLLAMAMPFVGFFSFRLNHPAYVSFCYAPWIILAWLNLAQPRKSGVPLRWVALWMAATWCEFTSGTVKEAFMLGCVVNAVGALAFLVAKGPTAYKWRMGIIIAGTGLGGLLLSAPWWSTFAMTLETAWTSYDVPWIGRIGPPWLVGLFDGMWYSENLPGRGVYCPSANFLMLLGVIWFLTGIQETLHNRLGFVFLLGAFVTTSLTFSVPWLPQDWILAIPGLRSVGHVHNTFACVTIILLIIPSGLGLAAGFERLQAGRWKLDLAGGGVLVTALLWLYFQDAFPQWVQAAGSTLAALRTHGYALATLVLSVAGWFGLMAARSLLQRRGVPAICGAMLGLASLLPMLARHGQIFRAGPSGYFLRTAARVELRTESRAVNWIHAHSQTPSRVFGLDGALFPGFSGTYEIEHANGVDGIENRAYRELAAAAALAPTDNSWRFPSDPAVLENKKAAFDFLNTRYFASQPDREVPWRWVSRVADLDLTIFENDSAWPRAFFTNRIVLYEDPAEVLKEAASTNQPFAALLREEFSKYPGLSRLSAETAAAIPASGYVLTTNKTRFRVVAPGPGLIVLHEAWLPEHFVARVNGREVPYLRVNHAFKAVVVEATGTYEVDFEYWPRWMNSAIGASFAGIAWLILLPFLFRRFLGPHESRPSQAVRSNLPGTSRTKH